MAATNHNKLGNVTLQILSFNCKKMSIALGLLILVSCISSCHGQRDVCSYKSRDMKMDQALLNVINDKYMAIKLRIQSKECYKCRLPDGIVINPGMNCSLLVDTRWETILEITTNKSEDPASTSCGKKALSTLFAQSGIYNIFITSTSRSVNCSVPLLDNDPPDVNIPIYIAIGVLVGAALLWIVMKDLYNRGTFHRLLCCWNAEGVMVDLGSPTNINAPEDQDVSTSSNKDDRKVKKERLKSLDAFRGLSIIIMIFANYRGGFYWFFKHSKWNGLTVADLVFPWFVFIMGTALAYSFSAQLRRGMSKKKMLFKVVKRSVTLFILGLLVNSVGYSDGVKLEDFRIPGVLQRFAGTYLITAGIHIFFARSSDASRDSWWAPVRDIFYYWPEWLINFGFVILHLCVTFYMNVPGCPRGYLGPGGDAEDGDYMNCTGGAAGYIDRKVFGDAHIYQNPTCKEIYNTKIPYDPEGLLGTLNSCFLCFLGLQAGKILLIHKDWVLRSRRLFIWSIFTGGIALLLCKATKNDGWIPINKNLWSLSFILAMASMAFLLLMVCYLVIDVFPLWSGSPFYYPGMNAIVLYVGHEFFSRKAPVYFHIPHTHQAQLPMTLWGTTFWVLVAYYMYYKDIFITV